MPTFYQYDINFRNITASSVSADADAYRLILQQAGVTFIETDDLLPNIHLDFCGVTNDFQIVEMDDLPESCRPESDTVNVATVVPEFPDLPKGGTVTPSPGTPLTDGTTFIEIRAPLYKRWQYAVTVYTAEHAKADLVAFARNARWELEQAGAPYAGLHLATDDRCKLLIQSTVTAVDLMIARGLTTPETWTAEWLFNDGTKWIKRADLDDMTLVLMSYVSGLFATCAAIEAKIATGEITTQEQVTAALSPGGS